VKCRQCGNETNNLSFCSHRCSAIYSNTRRRLSDATKAKISKTLSEKDFTVEQRKNLSDRAVLNLKRCWDANRAKQVETLCLGCGLPIRHRPAKKRKYHYRCWLKNSGGYRENSTIKHASVYHGFKMDSGAERRFAELLDAHGIIWKKNTTQFFPYIDIDNVKRKYYPDFYLPEHAQWVEIKGKFYTSPNDNLKLKAVGDNIELIMSHDIRLPSIVGL
jgi:ferredoxin